MLKVIVVRRTLMFLLFRKIAVLLKPSVGRSICDAGNGADLGIIEMFRRRRKTKRIDAARTIALSTPEFSPGEETPILCSMPLLIQHEKNQIPPLIPRPAS
jgi:hypothetical protein